MQNKVLDYSQYIDHVRQIIKEVTCEEYAKTPEKYPILVDVREADECQSGILPGALVIPRGLLEAKLSGLAVCENKADPTAWLAQQNILLYCRSGGRSALAAESLLHMGFKQVFSLAGGTLRWRELDYKLSNDI
ncbi:rhodanese-like domain-containing protein [Paraglaciecola sp. 20A4]|uniref:rhodanese-like domain-containing protein n=1 Tax=Paraglaciecola sp. 20A4 TaxID=2687288 RepID=UPI00140C4402|nr:rhodanese-like domain-containing protein [Paraglaciecola sp. 20A4]